MPDPIEEVPWDTPSQGSTEPPTNDELYRVLIAYQEAYDRWQAAKQQEEILILKHENKERMSYLLDLIFPALRGRARGLLWKGYAPFADGEGVTDRIAYSLFAGLIEELPKLKLDPTKNILGLLVKVAVYRWRDDLGPRKLSRLVSLDEVAPDSPGLATDPIENQVLEELRRGHCRQLIEAFLDTCEEIDCLIMRARLQDPPVEYKDLVQHVGPGWNEAALRARYSRSKRRFQEYVKKLGVEGEL